LISFVDRTELPVYYGNNDVFLSTSIAETFGVAVCEAMATGMPVVATSSGGVDDTVEDCNGIKVNIRDHEAVANALVRIKTGAIDFDPVAVRESIVKKFGKTAFKARLNRLYNEAIV
jgi:glycosyltransferase involved in cell wall biosynthesis